MIKQCLAPLLMVLLTLAACSDHADDAKYSSTPPEFADIAIESLVDGTSTVRVGEKFVATAIQSQKGHLLYKGVYAWTTSPAMPQSYPKEVVYDDEPSNPTDTIIVSTPGKLTLTFKGTYHVSGNASTWKGNYSERLDNGTKVDYKLEGAGLPRYVVTLTKTINVLDAVQP